MTHVSQDTDDLIWNLRVLKVAIPEQWHPKYIETVDRAIKAIEATAREVADGK
jgi:hypothetical protein